MLCEYEDGMTCPLEAYRGREVLGCEIVASIFFSSRGCNESLF